MRSPSRRLSEPDSAQRRRFAATLAALAGLAACRRSPAPAHPLQGRLLPQFALDDLQGARKSVSDLKAQPWVLNLWASWCPPCRAEMSSLQNLAARFAARGLRVITVAADQDVNLLREFVLHHGIRLEVWLDPGLHTCRDLLSVMGIPASFLIDRDGRVARVVAGERRWDEEPALGWVAALLP